MKADPDFQDCGIRDRLVVFHKLLGLRLVSRNEVSDARILVVLQGSAIGRDFSGAPTSEYCYTAGEILGEITVSLPDPRLPSFYRQFSARREPPTTIGSCFQKKPEDSPIKEMWREPLVDRLVQCWGERGRLAVWLTGLQRTFTLSDLAFQESDFSGRGRSLRPEFPREADLSDDSVPMPGSG
jgi:hypothetical protein